MMEPALRFKRNDGEKYPALAALSLGNIAGYVTETATGSQSVYVGTDNMGKDCTGVSFERSDKRVKGVAYKCGDTLVSNIRPYLKKAWHADREGVCSTDVLCFRPNDKVDDSYLYSFIGRDAFFQYVMQAAKGSKMPRGDKNYIMTMPVSLPCLEEQQKIAAFLSDLDAVISASEDEVAALEQQKKGVMQKIFSREVRFKQDDGTEYPEWESEQIGDIIESYEEKVDTDSNLPILTSSKNYGIQFQSDHFGREQTHDIDGYNVLPRGYCTYRNRSDGVDFTFNINDICDVGIISKFYPVFKDAGCDLYFLASFLNNSSTARRVIAYTAVGTGQRVLSFSDLKSITLALPCLEEQQKIAGFLSSFDEAIVLARQELEKWKLLKKGLMQQMFV